MRLSLGQCASEGLLLFPESTNIVFQLYIGFSKLLHTSFEIYFALYKEYKIFLISFRRFSDVLAACTCANSISNLCHNCFEDSIICPLNNFDGNQCRRTEGIFDDCEFNNGDDDASHDLVNFS